MEKEHKPEGTRWIFPTGSVRKSCNEKRRSQPSKFVTTRKLQKWKYKYKWKHGKTCMIRAHKIFMEQTNDFHWKRTMANHSRKLAQNHVAAPLRREGIESDCGPSGQE